MTGMAIFIFESWSNIWAKVDNFWDNCKKLITHLSVNKNQFFAIISKIIDFSPYVASWVEYKYGHSGHFQLKFESLWPSYAKIQKSMNAQNAKRGVVKSVHVQSKSKFLNRLTTFNILCQTAIYYENAIITNTRRVTDFWIWEKFPNFPQIWCSST
jgi:hypothetical protein